MCKQCNARHGLGHPHVTLQKPAACAYCAEKDAEITGLKAELAAFLRTSRKRIRADG